MNVEEQAKAIQYKVSAARWALHALITGDWSELQHSKYELVGPPLRAYPQVARKLELAKEDLNDALRGLVDLYANLGGDEEPVVETSDLTETPRRPEDWTAKDIRAIADHNYPEVLARELGQAMIEVQVAATCGERRCTAQVSKHTRQDIIKGLEKRGFQAKHYVDLDIEILWG